MELIADIAGPLLAALAVVCLLCGAVYFALGRYIKRLEAHIEGQKMVMECWEALAKDAVAGVEKLKAERDAK